MKFIYDTLDLAELGELSVSRTTEPDGAPAAARLRHTLTVTLHFYERSFGENWRRLRQLEEGLTTQQGLLLWSDPETDTVVLNQTVFLTSLELPENETGWNEMLEARLTFTYYSTNLIPNTLPATFARTGATESSLGTVQRWKEEMTFERVNPLRRHRRYVGGRLTASGQVVADPTQPLANRRAVLQAALAALLAALNGAEGTLTYGSFTRTVRVESFQADLDDAGEVIGWSLAASFTRFPDEADYALVDFTVEERDPQTGEKSVVISGRVSASSSVKARAKAEEIRTAVLGQIGAAELRNEQFTDGSVVADADGETFLELNFSFEYRRWRSDNLPATYTPTGGTAVTLPNVRLWTLRYTGSRYDDLHSNRSHAGGMVEARGTILPGAGLTTLSARRQYLLEQQAALRAAFNSKDGELAFGQAGAAFSKVVRIVDGTAELNQVLQAVEWTVSAQWTEFPNEAGYALVELDVQTRESVEDGEQFLTLGGRIRAHTEAAARAKLGLLRESVLAGYQFAVAGRLRSDITARQVQADADGEAFLELSFSEEFRKRLITGLAWTLQVSDRLDVKTGLITTTYSGTVTAGAVSETAAYAAALEKAEALGANKYEFQLGSTVSFDQRQTTASNQVEFVRLNFSYEYQRRDGNLKFLEVQSEADLQTFGLDTDRVSGSVTASDYATAVAFYQSEVRAAFTGRLIEAERLSEGRQVQVRSGTTARLFLKVDFSLQVHRPKASGQQRMVYALEVSKNFQSLEKTTGFSGTVYAANRAEAEVFVDTMAGVLQLGLASESRRTSNFEHAGSSYFLKLDFSETYRSALTGLAQIVECGVTEEVTYSSDRLIEQPLPDGPSVIQRLGIEMGRRTVQATATASTRTVAENWCLGHRSLLVGTYGGQPQLSWRYVFPPMVTGVLSGSGANFQAVQVNATFNELLPNTPLV